MPVHLYSFGIEYIRQEVLSKFKDKSMTHSIFGLKDDDFFMCGTYYVALMKYIITRKTLSDCFHLFFTVTTIQKEYNTYVL